MKEFFGRRRVLGVPALALLAAFAWWVAPAAPGAAQAALGALTLGAPAPDFKLPDLDGKTVSLSEFKGKQPVLIYFWATWCPSCKEVKPELVKLRERLKAEDLAMLAVNVGHRDPLERVKSYQKANPIPLTVLYDDGTEVTQRYGVRGIPYFVVVSKAGDVIYKDHELPQDIRSLMR